MVSEASQNKLNSITASKPPMLINSLVEYIKANRGDSDAWYKYTDGQIFTSIAQAIVAKCAIVDLHDGEITGVAVGHFENDGKTVFIEHILTTDEGAIKRICEAVLARYPYVTKFRAYRRAIIRVYPDAAKLLRKLMR